jgi:hypothetical protein
MKTHIIIGITILCLASAAIAEDPYEVAWIAQIGTLGMDTSHSVAVDTAGNVYISGTTDGSLGGSNVGNYDAFLTKFDALGNELWTQQIGSASYDSAWSVAVDALGNAYISGHTKGDLGGVLSGPSDAFLASFNPSGIELWRRQIGTTSSDGSTSMAVDAAGNVYISGTTDGSLGGGNVGSDDVFLSKFDSSGNMIWAQQIGSANGDYDGSVAVDAFGNAYVSGNTYGSLGSENLGDTDAFLTRFDPSGNELWTRQIGTEGYDYGWSVAVDACGNAYVSGETQGDLCGINAGNYDAFLIKFDVSGDELWRQQIGTESFDESFSVAVDNSGNAYISGWTDGSMGGPSVGGRDAFLAKFSNSGNLLWIQQIGTGEEDFSYAVSLDVAGNAYISGYTMGSLGGVYAGQNDAFVMKFENPVPEPATMSLLALGWIALLRKGRRL